MIRKTKGITLAEMLVALAIIAILAAISITTYKSQIRKSRRVDAIETLLAISLAEARYRTSNSQYGTIAQVWNNVSTTAEGYYTLATSNISGTTYTITATAQGDQANDTTGGTACTTLTLSEANGTITKSPTACWPK